jgi:hypothetical protein
VCKKTFSRSVVRGLHGSIQLFGRSTISFNNAWVVLLECPSGEAYKGSLHGDKNVGVSWRLGDFEDSMGFVRKKEVENIVVGMVERAVVD